MIPGGLGAAILASCGAHARSPALVGAGTSITYAELGERAAALAASLRGQRLEPNEPVVAMVANRPLDLVAFAGVWLAGGAVVPVHRSNPAAVVGWHVEATGARIVLDADGPEAPASGPTGWAREGDLLLADRPPPAPRALLDGAALVIFTSGSTGAPKGAVLSHRGFGGKLDVLEKLLAFRAGERTLLVLNITFSFGDWVSLATLRTGGTLVMHEKFAPLAFCEALAGSRVDRTAVVPTMMRALAAELEREPVAAALAAANRAGTPRQLFLGGEALGRALAAELTGRFPGARLIDIYGLTETSTSDFCLFPEDLPHHAGTIGRPSPNVAFRIARPGGEEAPAGEVGELQIRTPYIMSGYLDAPELTAAAFQDGWFRTGDLARVREGGVVELAGRAKELIVRGGNKVSPLEIEQVFAAHPDVAAAMATGLPDPILGERIHLLVVLRPGRTCGAETLREFAAPRLPKFKQPDAFHFADALPLGRTGKADRGALRALLAARDPGGTVARGAGV